MKAFQEEYWYIKDSDQSKDQSVNINKCWSVARSENEINNVTTSMAGKMYVLVQT